MKTFVLMCVALFCFCNIAEARRYGRNSCNSGSCSTGSTSSNGCRQTPPSVPSVQVIAPPAAAPQPVAKPISYTAMNSATPVQYTENEAVAFCTTHQTLGPVALAFTR